VQTGFWWGDLRERDRLEGLGVDGSIILKAVFKKYDGGIMNWIDLAEDRDRWRAVVNTAMNIHAP
jgi:hypothetical protein